jgi:hypothetical protein
VGAGSNLAALGLLLSGLAGQVDTLSELFVTFNAVPFLIHRRVFLPLQYSDIINSKLHIWNSLHPLSLFLVVTLFFFI